MRGLPASVISAIEHLPDAIASAAHPTARLAPLLGDERPPGDNRSLILQAVLVSTLL